MLTSGWDCESRGRRADLRKALWVMGGKWSVVGLSLCGRDGEGEGEILLHPSRATAPVAVVNVKAFALEDECADAVLRMVIS
jgi:hypothetical protein